MVNIAEVSRLKALFEILVVVAVFLGIKKIGAMAAAKETERVRSKLPNVDKVIVDYRKVTDYALNPNHFPGGSEKAQAFANDLGYNQHNAGQLVEQIQSKLQSSKAVYAKLDQYGQRITMKISITGPNGDTVVVHTVWILKTGTDIPVLITLFAK
jgi:hypothetical protein